METLIQDLRFGFRRLLKGPAFTIVAVLSLALGVGANAAIFSLINAVLLRPLPITDPSKVLSVQVVGKNDSLDAFSYPNYLDFRDRNEVLSGLLVYRFAPMSLSRERNNERVWGYEVSGNYFDVLGVPAVRGRMFSPEEDRARNASPVAVLSYGCWQRRFGADPQIVGKEITLNGHTFNVVGIAPEGFTGTEIIYTPEVWVPMMMADWIEPGSQWIESRGSGNIFAIGRLKRGVSVKQAEASLNLLAEQLGKEYPETNEGRTISLMPPGLIIPSLRGAVVSFAWVLMAAVALVLMIACTNLAGLLLARVTERRKEIAIRLALGANRMRLIRQLLTESVLLSVVGGAAGVVLAVWIVAVVVAFKPPVDFPLTIALELDWRVMLFSLLVSLATGIVFGLMPSLQASKPDLVTSLKDTTAQAGYRRSRLRSGLIVVQIALSLVLLVAAAVVVRALLTQTVNPGFQTENGLAMSVDLGLQGYDETRAREFQRRMVESVSALPGVRSASIADFLPLSLNYSGNGIYIEGQEPVRGADVPTAMVATVGVRYFETMGIPLLQGRDFSEQDKKDTPQVAIVNEAFARSFFPGTDPAQGAIGKRISFKSVQGPFVQIIGVAKDGKYFNIAEEPRPFVYSSLLQNYSSQTILIARTTFDSNSMIGSVRNEVQKLDPGLPIFDIKTLSEHMRLSLFPARIAATVLGGFGALAVTLAIIGIYGVTSYSVAQRTREVGIRMALGASQAHVLRLVLGQGIVLVGIGSVIGVVASIALTRLMSGLLFGVTSTDPLILVAVPLLLAGVALGACFVPARRATKVDPMVALRYE
ncbi:MAG TPA: ABC transporter permease [Blastocatellia bacterium]|nr:ABC transporter permease [Blastocatellia bacterium]